jgi:hypothetical protein
VLVLKHPSAEPPPDWAEDEARRILAAAHIAAAQRGESEWHALKDLIARALADARRGEPPR